VPSKSAQRERQQAPTATAPLVDGFNREDEMSSVGTWKVTLQLFDHEDTTAAHAVLTTDTGTVHGHGRAKRNPSDLAVPEIGVELAAARALRDLADHLLRITSDDISEVQHEQHVHLTH
jgi:hypothetical protein